MYNKEEIYPFRGGPKYLLVEAYLRSPRPWLKTTLATPSGGSDRHEPFEEYYNSLPKETEVPHV